MKFKESLFSLVVTLMISVVCSAQTEPDIEPATPAVLRAIHAHDLVVIGESHGNQQEYEWLRSLVATPEFADLVDDIVMEFGNSLYQQSVDRYISGEDISLAEVQGAWRDTVASVGPPSPVYESLYRAVRETNMKRKGKHQMRVLCGDPGIDWQKVKEGKDILPYLSNREQSYTQVVKNEVMARHHRALLIIGSFHIMRGLETIMPARKTFDIEQQLRSAGANPYLMVLGTNTTGTYELDHRFDSWPAPVVVSLPGNWVGELPASPVVAEGHGPPLPSLKLKDAADALLYVGPLDSLVTVPMPAAELVGTPYGKEIERRVKLQMDLEQQAH